MSAFLEPLKRAAQISDEPTPTGCADRPLGSRLPRPDACQSLTSSQQAWTENAPLPGLVVSEVEERLIDTVFGSNHDLLVATADDWAPGGCVDSPLRILLTAQAIRATSCLLVRTEQTPTELAENILFQCHVASHPPAAGAAGLGDARHWSCAPCR